MATVLHWFQMRPLRLLGLGIVFISVGLLAFLTLLDMVAGFDNPYLGILTYMILPAPLGVGLALVPLDWVVQQRRIAAGKPSYPMIDLSVPFQRRIAIFFGVTGVAILIVGSVVSYRAVEFMDTKTFCGKVCHKVMIPEYTAYMRSSHKSVNCVPCHIGPGAQWFVKAKLSGLPQVYHSLLGDYQRPLETPVHALRPSRDTCENCHRPDQLYGSKLRTHITYLRDKENTRQVETMVMHVGSGGQRGSGIHGHMASTINYIPANHKRTEMAWVRVQRPDGTVHEYNNPNYAKTLDKVRNSTEKRTMDCIDCHNRAAHDFRPFEELFDHAVTAGKIDRTLPFIKDEAMKLVGTPATVPTKAQFADTLEKLGKLSDFYATKYPEVAKTRAKELASSLEAVQQVYAGTYFPHMGVGPQTYPSLRSHDGCFRCHGTLVRQDTGGTLSADCNLCHSEQVVGAEVALPAKP